MTNNSKWTENSIPTMTGKIAVVTGANSGIGYETARALAQKGGMVVMACRSLAKANDAAAQIRSTKPTGAVEVMQLDLGDRASVRQLAAACRARYARLDLIVNNAGIMVPPYGQTVQGSSRRNSG